MSSRRGFLARPEGGSASLGLVIRTDIAVLFVGDEDEKQALLPGEPDVFFTAPGYRDQPLVMLRLVEVDGERLSELVIDAWWMRVPDELQCDLTDVSPPAHAGSGLS